MIARRALAYCQHMPLSRWTAFVVLALSAGAALAQTIVTKRATELRDGPGESARSISQLPAQTPLNRLTERAGPWVQVQVSASTSGGTPGASGWVHLFDIGSPQSSGNTANNSGASGLLRGVSSFFNRGTSPQGTSVATSTIGVRGLSAEDLAKATPNLAAVDQMEALRADANAAFRFASVAALKSVAVDPLAAPETFATPSTTNMPVGRDPSQ